MTLKTKRLANQTLISLRYAINTGEQALIKDKIESLEQLNWDDIDGKTTAEFVHLYDQAEAILNPN